MRTAHVRGRGDSSHDWWPCLPAPWTVLPHGWETVPEARTFRGLASRPSDFKMMRAPCTLAHGMGVLPWWVTSLGARRAWHSLTLSEP